MRITVNILYQGKGENARLFADEMVSSGLVDKIRQQSGNLRYEYFVPLDNQHAILLIDEWENQEAIDFHHKSPMMAKIAELREKYQLRLKVTCYQQID
ncbi:MULTISPECIES: antibiotic biosynthesis monooxygenase family protein [Lactococcus]|jgi:quinol monooxygenase YgiN|uniref:antibiotic biosynthesis monooxygenase family protein n=1 Tax=Lactococcus TaxID=1357 RepID=UPI00024D8FCF|nr:MULTISPECIES: putative quinol monooxygenase [Lactococcus]MCA2381450.1 antibiotic biosynthesis monooxygenase [Lactococcus sp. SK2-659]MCI2095622.1 antibiotic biosynthesis monooxygenase [Lactococcus lactis]MCI2139537.1 antibiotic biosynthesis monooxygenase [Lactococcus lactis]MCI2189038.1 antibiotic biosynthesis monooxygenase [Lactococcus lactis]THA53366.1 antibiotic biosynthesis monooxygenase [Lactococcus lactis]